MCSGQGGRQTGMSDHYCHYYMPNRIREKNTVYVLKIYIFNNLRFAQVRRRGRKCRLLQNSLPPSHCRISCDTLAKCPGCVRGPSGAQTSSAHMAAGGHSFATETSPLTAAAATLHDFHSEHRSWKVPPHFTQWDKCDALHSPRPTLLQTPWSHC